MVQNFFEILVLLLFRYCEAKIRRRQGMNEVKMLYSQISREKGKLCHAESGGMRAHQGDKGARRKSRQHTAQTHENFLR